MSEDRVLSDLVQDPKNRRTHSARNLAMVEASLREVGAARSIVIDEDDVILAGNGVATAAADLGLTKLRVVEVEGDEIVAVRRRGLSEAQKRALAMYDNRTAELSTWNVEQLQADALEGLDLTAFWTAEELARVAPGRVRTGRTDPDAVPEVRPTSIVRGDLFALGAHRLLCGDCTQASDVARVMGDARAGLCFTSPPYANQRTYTGDADLSTATLARFIPTAAPFVSTFAINLGIVRRGGFVQTYWDTYLAVAADAGFGLLSWNVWARDGGGASIGLITAMFPIQHEWIFVLGRAPVDLVPTIPNKNAGEFRTMRIREATGALRPAKTVQLRPFRELGTVITLPTVEDNADHPAQFPVALPRAYIDSFEGDVFDPFAGSGTTIIASEELGRACRAIEIAPAYCQVILDRWEAFTGLKAAKVDPV